MAITYTNGTNGLFDILGTIFDGLKIKNTARGTTIAAGVTDAIAKYKLKTDATLDLDRDIQGLANAELYDRTNNTLAASYQAMAQALLIGIVRDDSANDQLTLQSCLEYLIDEMESDGYYVDNSTVTTSPAPDGGNSTSDLKVYSTDLGGDGLEIETILAETINIECTTGGASPVLAVLGERAPRSKLAESWPGGSGISYNLTPITHDNSVIENGDFETATIEDTPDDWNVEVGTPGTTVELSAPTQQTIIISGTPTAGSYFLNYTDPLTTLVHTTPVLAFDAAAADVQTALRTISGLEDVTVTASGTGPNYTHTVVFTGVGVVVAALTSTETFDTGSIAHAITVTGEPGANTGVSLVFKPHASELTAISQPITMIPQQVYAWGFWCDPVVASGNIKISIYDSVGGTIVQDDAAADQASTTSPVGTRAHYSGFFQVAKNTAMPVYVHLAKTAAYNTDDVLIDDIIIAPATQLYPGGPYVAVFGGRIGPAIGDKWTITNANNGGGEFQQYFDAVFDTGGKNLQLPVSGSTNIPDTLIT